MISITLGALALLLGLLSLWLIRENNKVFDKVNTKNGLSILRLRERVELLDGGSIATRFRVRRLEAGLSTHEEAAGGFWRDGRKILSRIRDLSDGHLENVIAFCWENKRPDDVVKALNLEWARRLHDKKMSEEQVPGEDRERVFLIREQEFVVSLEARRQVEVGLGAIERLTRTPSIRSHVGAIRKELGL